MACVRYLELLSARLDGALTGAEERELEEHLSVCPDCRAAEAQLAALQAGFDALEDVEAPEGFAQSVMERIRAEEPKSKVIPLFQRPQFRAVAGLAACLVLVVGLYGAAQQKQAQDDVEEWDMRVRSFSRDALTQDTDSVDDAVGEPEDEVAGPMITNYDGLLDVEAQQTKVMERFSDNAVLILERLPQGAEDLIPPETAVSYNPATGEEGYCWMTDGAAEALAQLERLAAEQGMSAERSSLPAEELLYDLVILSN